MQPEKYSVTWHSYSDHLKSMIKELMMNEDLSDVTLVTEDNQQIKAHINILSACSPVLKEILKKQKNSIINLRDIQFSEMESIMQFIYLGEATFYGERMDEFLAVAKSLKIKALCNAVTEINDELKDKPSPETTSEKMRKTSEQIVISKDIIKQAPQIKKESVRLKRKFACDQCGYQATQHHNLTKHIQSIHEGVKYCCDHCDHQFTDKGYLKRHIQSKHEGVRYACDQCDYQAKHQPNLKIHIQTKHEGVKFACDQCDYQDSYQGNLTRHIQSKHVGSKYACDHCDNRFTKIYNLKIHIQSKHEGARYACEQCDYQASKQSNLTRHINSKHEVVKYAAGLTS